MNESTFGQVPSAQSASDAGSLDGKDSTEFLGSTGKAAGADRFDGLDSPAFARAQTGGDGSPTVQVERVSSIAIASNRDFGDFKIRAPSIANSFQVCNDATATRTFVIYTGGGSAATDSTRQQLTVLAGACSSPFSTGGDDSDFQVYGPGAVVFGGPSGGFRAYDLWAIRR